MKTKSLVLGQSKPARKKEIKIKEEATDEFLLIEVLKSVRIGDLNPTLHQFNGQIEFFSRKPSLMTHDVPAGRHADIHADHYCRRSHTRARSRQPCRATPAPPGPQRMPSSRRWKGRSSKSL